MLLSVLLHEYGFPQIIYDYETRKPDQTDFRIDFLHKTFTHVRHSYNSSQCSNRYCAQSSLLRTKKSGLNLPPYYNWLESFLEEHFYRTVFYYMMHCKPKPCKAHRELPVSQFSQEKHCFHYREPLFSLQGPCFHCRDFPVNPCTSLLGTAVNQTILLFFIPQIF